MAVTAVGLAPTAVEVARERARQRLLAAQAPGGWWQGGVAANAAVDAEDLLLREFLGVRTPEQTAATARWIRSRQQPNGTWPTHHGGPGDLSTSVEAYAALRLAGDPIDAPHLTAAAAYVRAAGGPARARAYTRIRLALFGLWPYDALPALPPELLHVPAGVPLGLADRADWARRTIVPLTVVSALRPVRAVPFDLAELDSPHPPPPRASGPAGLLDAALRRYGRRPLAGPRATALRRAADWLLARQEPDGSWGGCQPPWASALIALRTLGYGPDHPAVRRGLAGLDRYARTEPGPDGDLRRVEPAQFPVADTALAVAALHAAGTPAGDAALVRAAAWLRDEEVRRPGDWQERRPRLAPGGWSQQVDNAGAPDSAGTAAVALALAPMVGARDPQALRPALDRAAAWLSGLQGRDGGWAAYAADNTARLPALLPMCDVGAPTDRAAPDLTAAAVEALCALGHGDRPAAARGVAWLLGHQQPDGSWSARWDTNHVVGTAAALAALAAAGIDPASRAVRRAVRWLVDHQNDDGGWGEDPRSYRDPGWIGRGSSTPSQTARAVLGLLAVGERAGAAAGGIGWLVRRQRPDGSWDEPEYTAIAVPGDLHVNRELYRLVYPLRALGRYTAD
ncbi:squalene-hopene cyclase [Pilimelia anulata]|uniref:Squalene-hopene cyclase n=1 Tax=Pilimelia anulata TaxID=53371 RepID=A0A8J3B3C3_9ACTN|nr:squalene--hopene cyclase [Pilimelia anulata]GGJ79196.1 squalene-hopene cyclase [Pilimelia anulata]